MIADGESRGSFSFGKTVSGFLAQPDLPFAEVLSAERIESVFGKHRGLFGRTYTTAIALWGTIGRYHAYCYDEFGRRLGRTDYNASNLVDGTPDIHYHRWEYTPQFPLGHQVESHIPGEFPK